MSLAFEERLDSIENQLKEKISIQAAFADKEVQARQLKKTFQFFDINDSGSFSYWPSNRSIQGFNAPYKSDIDVLNLFISIQILYMLSL